MSDQAPILQNSTTILQSSTNEPQTGTATTAAAPANPELTARFTQLSKKEAALVKERQAFKREQEALQSERKKIEEVNKRVQEFENLKKANALDAIKYLGFTDTDIFNALASVPEPTAEDKMKKVVQDELSAYQKMQQEKASQAQAEQDKKIIGNFKTNIMQTITKDPSKYEFCNYHGEAAKEQVFELIETHFKESGEVIPLNEALDIVEEFYESTAKEMSEKVSKLKVKPTETSAATEQLTPQVSPKPSLTRQPTSAAGETREQKRARLIAQIKQTGLKR